MTFGAAHLAAMQYIARAIPVDRSATAQALYGALATGMCTALAMMLAGAAYDRLGAGAYLTMAAMGLVGPGWRCCWRRGSGEPLLADGPRQILLVPARRSSIFLSVRICAAAVNSRPGRCQAAFFLVGMAQAGELRRTQRISLKQFCRDLLAEFRCHQRRPWRRMVRRAGSMTSQAGRRSFRKSAGSLPALSSPSAARPR